MGKASSAKKVARAARTGGSTKRDRPKLVFPLAIFTILVMGGLLVFVARSANVEEASAVGAPSSAKKDHWHAAYGVYVCDHFLPPLQDIGEDKLGIHTHGEGIIHIHPFSGAASGTKAKLKIFGDQVGLTFTDNGFKTPDGTTYENGYSCNGKPAKVAIYRYMPDDPSKSVEVFENDFGNINYANDREAYTIAVLPEGAPEPPPQPDSVAELDNLTDVAPTDAGAAAGGLDPSALDPSAVDPNTGLPTDPNASIPTPSLPTDPDASVSSPASEPAPATP